jgi:hypothetical protein
LRLVPVPRRLPVLGDAESVVRPPWQKAALGALFAFVSWVPLAALARFVSKRAIEQRLAGLAPAEAGRSIAALAGRDRAVLWLVASGLPLASVALASLFGGLFLARLGQGDLRAGRRGGALFGGIAWLLAVLAAGIGPNWAARAISVATLSLLLASGWALGGVGAALGARGKS